MGWNPSIGQSILIKSKAHYRPNMCDISLPFILFDDLLFFFWVERMNGLSKKKKKQMIFTAHRVKQLENLSPNTNILCFE